MTVRTDRPRLWLTPDTLAALKARAVPTNPRWQALLDIANRPGAGWDDAGIAGYALTYLMTGDPQYAAKAWTLMSQSMQAGLGQVSADSGYPCRSYLPASAILYDWCHDALTDAQRSALQKDIEACADWVYPRTNPSRAGGWAIDSVGNNYHAGFQYTWLSGLALSGDSPKAQGYIDEALRRWNSMVLPYLNATAAGGALFEGTSYSVDWLGMTLQQLLAHSTATGEDLLTPQLTTGWCKDALQWLIHMTTPTRDRLVPLGDMTKSSGGALQDAARIPMLAAASQNYPGAQIWLDTTVPNRCQMRNNAWTEFLWGNSTVTPTEEPTGFPRSAITYFSAPGAGLVSSRSGWGPDDTQVTFQCGPTLESHQDRAQGEFMLFRGNWLAGQAKLCTQSGIAQGCEDHNCLSVNASPQAWTQAGCRPLTQEDTPGYTYLKGDLAAAYPGQFSTYQREPFFVKPGFLLVRDRFAFVNPSSKASFVLQTLAQPVLNSLPFTHDGFAAGRLFGRTVQPPLALFTSTTVKKTPDQPVPSYRLDLPDDGTGEFIVALEAGAAGQLATSFRQAVYTNGLKGIALTDGGLFAAWVTGAGPWSYPSPGSQTHYLVGLKPSTAYTVNGGTVTSSAAGVLAYTGALPGVQVTVTEGNAAPPPPPPPVKTYAASGTLTAQPDGSLSGTITLVEKP